MSKGNGLDKHKDQTYKFTMFIYVRSGTQKNSGTLGLRGSREVGSIFR